MPPTLVIVDDHAGFRRVARALLSAGGFEVTGEAADGDSALRSVAELQPDVVLLDVQLPDIDGFEVAQRLAALPQTPAMVLVSTRTQASLSDRLAQSPALAFIAKEDLSPQRLTELLAR
jgi:two-component system nitrate/nitrite response regulator NarL